MQDDEAVVLQGEKEAEKMIVEAYAALLLAFLSTERFVHLLKYFLLSEIISCFSVYFFNKISLVLPLAARAYVMLLPTASQITN